METRSRKLRYIKSESTTTEACASNLILFPKFQMLPIDNIEKNEKEKREIPRRRKPVVQQQGHRVPELQAELEEQGLQKLDNQ